MDAKVFIDKCLEYGIDFFAGVPDSQLKGLCDELFARYGTDGKTHVVAHNEGGAVAMCAGHFLATGHPGLCYMQNSGLGNAVNPLASLMDKQVYALPCLLVVGWRGEPGIKDEPQHVKQGQITPGQLDLLGIPYHILERDETNDTFIQSFNQADKVLRSGGCFAFVVRKGALTTESVADYSNGRMLKRETAASMILTSAGPKDVFVSTTGKLSREVFEIREQRGESHERDFLTVGSMGHAGMIALGIAEADPGRRVWCLEGDGAMMMHLGAAALIGQRKPDNLIHVIINNGAHETVGGMPVCSGKLNIASFAAAAGYPAVFSASDEKELSDVLVKAQEVHTLCLIEIKCANGARSDLGRPTTTPVQNRDALMRFLKQVEKQ